MTQETKITIEFGSTATPTDTELEAFAALTEEEQRAIIKAELDKGLSSGVSDKSVDEILQEVRARHRKHAV